ncbi:uncharacterized protein LOC115088241 isoform X2 [Rhinatrema bivittatum]|nr:uncharacterized protein LOC115088241 isoform X2 [Rhinatrema bivittatum]
MGFHQKSQRHEVLQAVLELRLQQELEDLMDIIDDDTTMKTTEYEQVHATDSNAVFTLNLECIDMEVAAAEGTHKKENFGAYVQTTSQTQYSSLLERPHLQAQQHQVAIMDDSFSLINHNLRAIRGSLAGMHKDMNNMTKAMYAIVKSINKLAKRNVTLNAELVCTNQALGETMQRLSGILEELTPLTDLRTMANDGIIRELSVSSPPSTPQTSETLPGRDVNPSFPQRRQRMATRGLKRVKSKQI